MRLSPEFLLKITKTANSSEKGSKTMHIIAYQPYIHLEKELQRAFKGQEDVKVTVDRRYGERRTGQKKVELDRRKSDRRQSKEKLLEVVIST